MEEANVKLLLLAFLTLIIGVVLIGTVATSTQEKTTMAYSLNESLDISSARMLSPVPDLMYNVTGLLSVAHGYAEGDWQRDDRDCDISIYSITNSSSELGTDEYNTTIYGVITLINSTTNAAIGWGFGDDYTNISQVSYKYCSDDYIAVAWQRTILNIVPGFFGMALLLISVGLFYSIAKREGLLNI